MYRPERITRFPLFADLGPDALAAVAGLLSRQIFSRGQLIISQGQPADRFFLVEYGRVKVYRAGPDGREHVLHVIEPGQSFGEVAALSLATYPASAQALEETAALIVPQREFAGLIERSPAAARAMLASQARWLRLLIDQAAGLSLAEVPVRLARLLLSWAEEHQVALVDGAVLAPGPRKNVIAAQLGTVPETLSRALAKLELLALIERRGPRIVVRSAAGLRRLAAGEP